jgi:hypothetical protein
VFERLTDRARRLIVNAQESARALDHNYIGTEHFLLGFLCDDDGIALSVLTSFGITYDAAFRQIEEIIGRGAQTPTGQIPFTPRMKKVLELSLRESLERGHNYIGAEHLFLGLLREGEGVGVQVAVRLGMTVVTARERVLAALPEAAVRRPSALQDRPACRPAPTATLGHGISPTSLRLLGRLCALLGFIAGYVALHWMITVAVLLNEQDRYADAPTVAARTVAGIERLSASAGQAGSPLSPAEQATVDELEGDTARLPAHYSDSSTVYDLAYSSSVAFGVAALPQDWGPPAISDRMARHSRQGASRGRRSRRRSQVRADGPR